MSADHFDRFLHVLGRLRSDKADGVVKPYKPLLLLSVIVLIGKGKILDPRILLDGALKSVFDQLLFAIFPAWPRRPDPRYPFRHLENDGVWHLVPRADAENRLQAAREAGSKAREILESVACARMNDEVFSRLAASRDARRAAATVLVDRHLPPEAKNVVEMFLGAELPPGIDRAFGHDEARMTERAVEEYLFRNWKKTPFAGEGIVLADRQQHGLPGRQVLTPVNAIDLLGFQPESSEWWVFELKKGRPVDAVVGQVSRYLGWLAEDRRPHGERARGVVLAGGADDKLRYAVKANELLSLWTYDADMHISLVG